MATEWIDIVDTTIKIGLGAIITALASFSTTKFQNSKAVEKESKQIKREMLLVAVEKSDEYIQFLSEYFSRLAGLVDSLPKANSEPDFWQEAEDWVKEIEEKVLNARENVYIAQSRLQLLGFTEVTTILYSIRQLEVSIRQFYPNIKEQKKLPTSEFLDNWTNQFSNRKNAFQQQVSNEFHTHCV